MLRSLLLTIIVMIFSITPSYAAPSAGNTEFNAGVKQFKNKKYKTALNYFLKSEKAGMKKKSLYYNIAVSYYKLGSIKNSRKYFKLLTKTQKFRQIAFHNLGLIAEKRKNKKTAIQWYKKSVTTNTDSKVSQLSNIQLDKLLKRKIRRKNKTNAFISLAFGNDDNITNAASNSPSNKSDSYLELFAFIKTPINSNLGFKGIFYKNSYNTISTENFSFYSLGVNYLAKAKNWRLIPEINLMNNTLNNTSYQSIIDYKLTAKRKLDNTSDLALRYRYSDIDSKNTPYDYLQGTRHQLRIDYKHKVNVGKLRLRYQLESNNRQNMLTRDYSPTRHILRARLKHKIANSWNLSEELAYRISTYGSAAGVTRKDTRLRLRVIAKKKINKEWAAGIRYTYTNNDSNIVSENYRRNNIQLFSSWSF